MTLATTQNPVNLPDHLVPQLKDNFWFGWNEMAIPYLGINLTVSVDHLYAASFPPMFQKFKKDLSQWDKLGLSWLGSINSVKMTPLPHILYLFRSLPIPIPRDQLSSNPKLSILYGEQKDIRFQGDPFLN